MHWVKHAHLFLIWTPTLIISLVNIGTASITQARNVWGFGRHFYVTRVHWVPVHRIELIPPGKVWGFAPEIIVITPRWKWTKNVKAFWAPWDIRVQWFTYAHFFYHLVNYFHHISCKQYLKGCNGNVHGDYISTCGGFVRGSEKCSCTH